ncbi:helix-turn-helix domain-containing protein [Gordonia caeni]|uniref:Helix-turn-helix domain-containing protein n=1 Tax=Gordonia caeni TaxID=1007097 RepID=A0ABP7PJC9_9ACTN
MATTSALLHPVRLRIVQTLVAHEEATTRRLHEQLHDIPIATLYRHMAHLVKHGLIEVADETQIRGTSEKTYRLAPGFANPSPDEIRSLSSDDLLTAFTVFTSTLISDFGSYLRTDGYDLEADYGGFTTADFWASAEEMEQLIATINTALLEVAGNAPSPQRRRRELATILIPRPEQQEDRS